MVTIIIKTTNEVLHTKEYEMAYGKVFFYDENRRYRGIRAKECLIETK